MEERVEWGTRLKYTTDEYVMPRKSYEDCLHDLEDFDNSRIEIVSRKVIVHDWEIWYPEGGTLPPATSRYSS